MKNKDKLFEEINEHTQYWDCYNDCPLEYNHTGKVLKIFKLNTLSFLSFFVENCYGVFDSKTYFIRDNIKYTDNYTIEELYKIWLDDE